MRTSNDTTLVDYYKEEQISPLGVKIALAIENYMALILFALHIKPSSEGEYLDEHLISRLDLFYLLMSNGMVLTRKSLNELINNFEHFAMDVDERIVDAIKDMPDLDENFKEQIAGTVAIVSYEIIYNIKKITPCSNIHVGGSPDYSAEYNSDLPHALATHQNYTVALDHALLLDLLEPLVEESEERKRLLKSDEADTLEAYAFIREKIQPMNRHRELLEKLRLLQLNTKVISNCQTTSGDEKSESSLETEGKVQPSRSNPKISHLQRHSSLWTHVDSDSFKQSAHTETEKEDKRMSHG